MSEEFIIEGGHPISGSIEPQGNKNEALPILCASLLNPHGVTIHNLPMIEDIRNLIKVLEYLGTQLTPLQENDFHSVNIKAGEIKYTELPANLIAPLRGSITLMAPILARSGRVFMPRPGGDKIGRRRIDTHLLALEALGAKVEVFNDGYLLTCEELIGANMLLDEASVTGTENAIMAASVAKGKTVIENAASEPHVQGLCRFMVSQGVPIEGIGSNVLIIEGVEGFENLKPCSHKIGPDYLEIGSFMSMAALTNGDLTIKNVNPKDLRMIMQVFERLGVTGNFTEQGDSSDLQIPPNQELKIRTDVHGEIPKIDDAPWPMFPADLISIALVTATQCEGSVLIHEKMFESRLYFTDKLIGMGAKIVLCDPHRAVVMGPSHLYAANLTSPDIRAGMALVIAALVSQGRSRIQNIIQIDRGYENIDTRLQSLNAKITRVN